MYLSIDVGGTFIKYAIMEPDGSIITKDKTPTPGGYEHTKEEFYSVLDQIYKSLKEQFDLQGICVSLPGQIDVEKGFVYGGGALPYLDGVYLAKELSQMCDGLNVSLENDAKCAALAEAWIGNAKDCKTAVVVVFGTGIGGGIVLDGKVHRGHNMVAGELSFWLDHISMEDIPHMKPTEELVNREDFLNYPKGFWHNKVSIMYLRKTIATYKGMDYRDVTGEMIYTWAEEDTYIRTLLEHTYLSIAKQLCNLYVILAPEVILIGGGISERKDFFEGIMKYVNRIKKMSNIFRGIHVDTCKYLNDSNLIGALRNYQQLFEEEYK